MTFFPSKKYKGDSLKTLTSQKKSFIYWAIWRKAYKNYFSIAEFQINFYWVTERLIRYYHKASKKDQQYTFEQLLFLKINKKETGNKDYSLVGQLSEVKKYILLRKDDFQGRDILSKKAWTENGNFNSRAISLYSCFDEKTW